MNLSSITQITTAKIADANVTMAKIADANVTTAKIADGSVTAAKLAAGAIPSSIPAGAIMPFSMNSAPSGWLAADGAAVSRTTYAALFAAIGTLYGVGDGSTTFALPDLRGYFVRGAGTNSNNTASGAFGAKQGDAFQAHKHNYTDNYRLGNSNSQSAGSGYESTFGDRTLTTTSAVVDAANGTPRTSTETRPANIALLYCIKF